jgi:hypothetical protein
MYKRRALTFVVFVVALFGGGEGTKEGGRIVAFGGGVW